MPQGIMDLAGETVTLSRLRHFFHCARIFLQLFIRSPEFFICCIKPDVQLADTFVFFFCKAHSKDKIKDEPHCRP